MERKGTRTTYVCGCLWKGKKMQHNEGRCLARECAELLCSSARPLLLVLGEIGPCAVPARLFSPVCSGSRRVVMQTRLWNGPRRKFQVFSFRSLTLLKCVLSGAGHRTIPTHVFGLRVVCRFREVSFSVRGSVRCIFRIWCCFFPRPASTKHLTRIHMLRHLVGFLKTVCVCVCGGWFPWFCMCLYCYWIYWF